MKIRIATADDANAIHAMHTRSVRELWPSHYTSSQIEGWIAGRTPEGYLDAISRGEMFVAEDGGDLLGFGHAVPGGVYAIYVAPEATGRGVGSSLLQHALADACAGDAGHVRLLSTLNAEGFYSKFGFEVVERKSVTKGEISLPVVVMQLPVRSN